MLAAAAILGSEVPRLAAWPCALAAGGYGAWLARGELRRRYRGLIIPAGDAAAMLDGVPMRDFDLEWRGPLAFARWRDAQGARQRLHFWPDTCPAPARRELRLAMIARATASRAGSMAP